MLMDINEKNFDTIEDLDVLSEEEIEFEKKEEIKLQSAESEKAVVPNTVGPNLNTNPICTEACGSLLKKF